VTTAQHAYLLRAWRDVDPRTGRAGPWRFSLEQPGAATRRGFRSLAELTAHFHLTFAAVDGNDPPSTSNSDLLE
jgi:hypothetical protein